MKKAILIVSCILILGAVCAVWTACPASGESCLVTLVVDGMMKSRSGAT